MTFTAAMSWTVLITRTVRSSPLFAIGTSGSASLAIAYDINRAGRIIVEHLRTVEAGAESSPHRKT